MTAHTPFGLYIHWPFCLAKCPYCDFNSHVADGAIHHRQWRDALLLEMEMAAQKSGFSGRRLDSIFIGGGTPSLMAPETAAALIAKARDIFGFAANMEITMEANPTSVEAQKLKAFADAGVNRLSVGVQSFNDDSLRFLGREHSADEARHALHHAMAIFPRVSADFIYALPGQNPETWEAELAEICATGLRHISLYQLTPERGTPFFDRHMKGTLHLPDDETARELFDRTHAIMMKAGLPGYEISNFATPGEECRHNLIYWNAHDWLGIGPGAIGRYWQNAATRMEMKSRRAPALWLEDIAQTGTAIHHMAQESPPSPRDELVMMGLRLTDGIETARLAPLPPALDPALLDALAHEGLLVADGKTLRLTRDGLPLINAVLARLLASETPGRSRNQA